MARPRFLVLVRVVLVLVAFDGCSAPASVASGSAVTSSPPSTPGSSNAGLRYVALGDSFTIGTSVAMEARWPDQLVAALGPTPPTLALVANLGVNGFTSRDVIDVELPKLDGLRPQFLTLLVGVNDVVQGVSADTFRRNAASILDDLVGRVPADRILVVTTPDYTVTPAGADFGDPPQQAAAIRANNDILTQLAHAHGITLVDIYDLSQRAGTDRSLVAGDGLHPSGAQYALWVARIAPEVERLLGR
jgi:lysophospholipase L1-like esterase